MKKPEHIQFWDKRPPSREDLLRTIGLLLRVAQDSVPLALRSLSTASFAEQRDFWESISDFDNESDCLSRDYTAKGLAEMDGKISDWVDVCGIRVKNKSGVIE